MRAAHAGHSVVASLVAAAAGLHLWAAYVHRNESWLLAAGFVGAAVLQLWAARTFVRSAGRVKVAIVTANLVAVSVWCLSRLVGLPFGSHAGVPEAVSALDALTVAIEVAALTGVVVLSWRAAGRPAGGNGRAATKLVALSCLFALGGGAALGDGGDHAEDHGHPAGVDVPATGQPAGALFDFHPEGHEGPCDLFHPCAEGVQP